MDSDFDIVIVGAGAAGLAAANALASAPLRTIVLEARGRIGGRAHTVQSQNLAVDLGCGWLHSALDNPFSRIAEQLGFEIDKSPPHWTRQAGAQNFSRADQAAFGAALGALEVRISKAATKGRDVPVSTLFDPACPFNPLLDAFSGFYNGAAFDQISTMDYDAYQDGEVNWRLTRGYGTLITAFGADAPVKLNTPVSAIDHSGRALRIETPNGTLSTQVVIVTLPTDVLAAGTLTFNPGLPAALQAAADLPLGLANKVFLGLDAPEQFGPDSHLFGDPSRAETGSYALRPMGRAMIEGYFGGTNARELERAGSGAATAFAIEQLCALLGSRFRDRLHPLAETRWAADPWSRGSYSHAAPGAAGARAILATPVEQRIIFAGEACSPHAFSTAHGAAESGRTAAVHALAQLADTRDRRLTQRPAGLAAASTWAGGAA